MGYFYLFLFVGIFLFFNPIFSSGWDTIPSSLLDGKLTNYIYEHIYLYFAGTNPLHNSLWSMPFFYPLKNTLAMSDSLLSTAPIYMFFRTFFDYAISYTMTVISFSVLNYVVFYFILRKLKFSKLLSSLGAFLYAFSYNHKITHLHVQLLIQFFFLATVLSMLYVSKHNSKKLNFFLFIFASASYCMGLYSSFYMGFLFLVFVLVALLITLCNRIYRRKLKIFIIRYWKEFIAAILCAAVFLIPMAKMYLSTGISRSYGEVFINLPVLSEYFTGHSYLVKTFFPSMLEEINIEKSLIFTYVLFAFGLFGLLKFKKYGFLLFLSVVICMLLPLKIVSLGYFSLWKVVYHVVPGAIGIREPIRMVLLINPFLVLGFIKFLSTSKWKKNVLIFLSIIVLAEQYCTVYYLHRSYSEEMETRNILGEILLPKNCRYLDVDIDIDVAPGNFYGYVQADIARIDLMWFASEHGLYFISGYSGLSEEDGHVNRAREELKKLPEYCVIKKNIKF